MAAAAHPGGSVAGVNLVNLTEHAVAVDAQLPASAEDPSLAAHSGRHFTIPPAGSTARVSESVSPVGQLSVEDTDGFRVHLTQVELARDGTPEGVPDPLPGTLFVVSRLTALAVRDRRDLVFPHGEHRDRNGAVIGVQRLARFAPDRLAPAVRRRWSGLAHRARWHPRRWGLGSPVGIAVAFSVGTALLGAAAGDLPNLLTTAARDRSHARHWWFIGASGGLGALLIFLGYVLWQRRRLILHDRGTAYVIEETADSWTHEEKQTFLSRLQEEFETVVRVPGPAALGRRWGWPLGDGAEQWQQHLAELVRAFWAVHYNDNQVTLNAVFVWAFWPVAIGFGARAMYGRRGLILHTHQRPTFGAQGIHADFDPRQSSHTFLSSPVETVAGSGAATDARWPVCLTIEARSDPLGHLRARTLTAQLVLLIAIRLIDGAIGPLDFIPAPTGTSRVPLTIVDASGELPLGTGVEVDVHEFSCLGDSASGHAWDDYPQLVSDISRWIESVVRAATPVPAGPDVRVEPLVLLMARLPQEIGIGLGVHISQSLPGQWPAHVLPVVYDGRTRSLVVPGLDLGRASLLSPGGW